MWLKSRISGWVSVAMSTDIILSQTCNAVFIYGRLERVTSGPDCHLREQRIKEHIKGKKVGKDHTQVPVYTR